MTLPTVSVVVETINARSAPLPRRPLADEVEPTLASIAAQSYPADLTETIVVVDDDASFAAAAEIVRRHPHVRIVRSRTFNYFDAKNAGAEAAGGEVVAFVDSDCIASPGWLRAMIEKLANGAGAVAGCSRYPAETLAGRTFSVFDVTYIVSEHDGASAFNLSNVAFRRDVLLAHPLETRLRRQGGCYLLRSQLRAAGVRVEYEPRASVTHAVDFRGFGFIRKHFERGYDGAVVYRLDDQAALRGTRMVRRLGSIALVPIHLRRIALDWRRLLLHRRDAGITLASVPFFALLAVVLRAIELAGGLAASVGSPDLRRRPGVAA